MIRKIAKVAALGIASLFALIKIHRFAFFKMRAGVFKLRQQQMLVFNNL